MKCDEREMILKYRVEVGCVNKGDSKRKGVGCVVFDGGMSCYVCLGAGNQSIL